MTALDAAEMLTARGWVVFPADNPDAGLACTGTARRCVERRCGAATDPRKRGKHPRVDRWGGLGVASAAQLAEWFADPVTPVNVALACGPSGIMVVDEDTDGALSAYAASIGEAVAPTFRVRTGRGWHWYYLVPIDPATGQRYRIGNSPGALGAWGCDVRGGASASAEHGGYVITAGSRHWSGITYTADEPYAPAVPAPPWLIAALLNPAPPAPYQAPPSGDPAGNGAALVGGGEAGEGGDRGVSPRATVDRDGGTAPSGIGQGVARWDKEVRYGSLPDLWAQYRRHCAEVAHTGAEFRHELFRAARDGWRLVNKGAHDQDAMLDELAECVARVWHAEPDDRDSKIVYAEALDGPSGAHASPWEIVEPLSRRPVEIEPGRLFTRPGEVVSGGQGGSAPPVDGQRAVAGVTEGERPTADEQDYARELRRQRFAQRAREELQAEKQDPLLEVDLDEWLDAPGPEWLVPGMLYRNGLAVVFGEPGAAKSFLILDIGLSLASGRPWLVGDLKVALPDGSRGITHYVMAEGRDTNALRTNAWLIHRNAKRDDLRGHFRLWDRAVQLTEPGIREYLVAVRRDKPDLIVFDTKNLMFVGKESQGEDYGAMLRILHIIRQEAGGCAIVLIDHTGLNATGRVRGGNAQKAGLDSEVEVADREGLRVARMTRDKSGPEGSAEWYFRLQQMDEVPRGKDIAAPAVCVPDDPATRKPFQVDAGWADDLAVEIPKAVYDLQGHGKAVALQVFRILRWVGGSMGLTRSELSRAILDHRRQLNPKAKLTPDQLGRALTLLTKHHVIEPAAGTTARFVLTAAYATEDGDGTVLG